LSILMTSGRFPGRERLRRWPSRSKRRRHKRRLPKQRHSTRLRWSMRWSLLMPRRTIRLATLLHRDERSGRYRAQSLQGGRGRVHHPNGSNACGQAYLLGNGNHNADFESSAFSVSVRSVQSII
jgi:hypothetical protein